MSTCSAGILQKSKSRSSGLANLKQSVGLPILQVKPVSFMSVLFCFVFSN